MFGRALRISVSLLVMLLAFDERARAETLPLERTLELGSPAHPTRVIFRTGDGLTMISGGKRRQLPARDASEVTIEAIALRAGASVAIFRVHSENGRWVGVLGGRSGTELLSFERDEPSGDPGERRSRELVLTRGSNEAGAPREPAVPSPPPELAGSAPDGRAVDAPAAQIELQTGLRYEGVSLCGGRPALYDEQRLDPVSLTWVPSGSAPALGAIEEARVSAVVRSGPAPLLAALAAVASSEREAVTGLPRAPRALVDGDPERGTALPPGSFALFRWQGGALPIERLELELSGSRTEPVELIWLGDREAALRARVPAGGAGRFAISPPRPLGGRCLALFVPRDAPPGLQVRELHAFTELDREGGLERLIGALVRDDAGAAHAADLLAELGSAVAERLAARWDELSQRGKRRGLRVLSGALERPLVRERLIESARSDEPLLREPALATLARGGAAGLAALRELALQDDAAGEEAARALGVRAGEAPALLAALAREGGDGRSALRSALEGSARCDPKQVREAASAWLAGAPPIGARAALALALARAGDRAFAGAIAEQHAPAATRFEDRYRFALALALAPMSPSGDAWLAGQVEQASEWMQRRAGFDALVQRGSPMVPDLAQKLVREDYPRLRAGALAPLVSAGQRALVEGLVARDPWPLVRAEGVRALARDRHSQGALARALADPARLVRRAAIEALEAQARADAWPEVQHRLTAADESLEVREAAIEFARALCVADAREPLLAVARAVLSPAAKEDDARLALEALRALHDLGGQAARQGAELVAQAAAPELGRIWARLPSARCERSPSS